MELRPRDDDDGHGLIEHRSAVAAMATRFELILASDDASALPALAELAIDEIRDCEQRLSRFAKGSLLYRVNQLAGDDWVAIDRDTFALLQLCQQTALASNGAFDPTRKPNGMAAVELDAKACAVRWQRKGLDLDLGAIGKGWALDLAATVLRDHGVERAFLHAGTSTVRAWSGRGPVWRVALTGPSSLPAVELDDGALSVSAPERGAAGRGHATSSHIVDPHRPDQAPSTLLAAVLAPTAATADAWSTAQVIAPATLPAGHAHLSLRAGSAEPERGGDCSGARFTR